MVPGFQWGPSQPLPMPTQATRTPKHPPPQQGLSTGQLCARAQVTRGTLRTYEALGLIEPMQRSAAGYRLYAIDLPERLAVIRAAKAMGLTLRDIREQLPLLEPDAPARPKLLALVKKHVAALNAQIEHLQAIQRVFAQVLANPAILTDPGCDITDELVRAAPPPSRRTTKAKR
jgi:MerR family transcriptional regulator, copper efflux regulator